jgi:hypothetical protein
LVMAAHSCPGVVRMNVTYTCSFFSMFLSFFDLFETQFKIAQRLKAMAFVLADPAFAYLMQRHRIEVMQTESHSGEVFTRG